jgi:membrane-associated phospholipid phosphatase
MRHLTSLWPVLVPSRSFIASLLASVSIFLTLFFVLRLSDEIVVRWAVALPDGLREFFRDATELGDSAWILYPALIGFLLLRLLSALHPMKLVKTALKQLATGFGFVFLAVGLPGITSTLLKNLIGRARPKLLDSVGSFSLKGPSFEDYAWQSLPSGHTTTSFAFAFAIAFLVPGTLRPLLLLAAVIGFSRIVVNAHYPTDVLAGIALGAFGAVAVRNLFALRGWVFRITSEQSVELRPLALLRLLRRQIPKKRSPVG